MKPKKFAMGGMPVGRAAPNRMMSPSMTPAGGAALSQLVRGMGGGRPATPEEVAKMNSTMSSLGMSRPQFNPADADKLRAQMQSRLAAQGMQLPASQTLGGPATRMAGPNDIKPSMPMAPGMDPIKAGLTGPSQLPTTPVSTQGAGGPQYMKKGGVAKTFAKGGMIDGIAQRGKTKCKIC